MEIKNRIVNYWTNRSSDFAKLRKEELSGYMAELWLAEIAKYLPVTDTIKNSYKILDVGTGTGFFSILLAKNGYNVIGIDLTKAMIDEAGKLAQSENLSAPNIEFQVMDAENLLFEDETFDAIITRNLTWTLPHPKKAYHEWNRVLKKGGLLLNFDADYGTQRFDKKDDFLPENHAHRRVDFNLRNECELIKESISINAQHRPAWDLSVLKKIGYNNIKIDTTIGKRIYHFHDQFYNPAPVFLISALK